MANKIRDLTDDVIVRETAILRAQVALKRALDARQDFVSTIGGVEVYEAIKRSLGLATEQLEADKPRVGFK